MAEGMRKCIDLCLDPSGGAPPPPPFHTLAHSYSGVIHRALSLLTKPALKDMLRRQPDAPPVAGKPNPYFHSLVVGSGKDDDTKNTTLEMMWQAAKNGTMVVSNSIQPLTPV